MTPLRVLPEAEQELAEAAGWYESKRPGLGVELIAAVDSAFDEIREAPLASPLWRTDCPFRAKLLSRFPYVVFFRSDGTMVEVVAVAHAKRRPGYWSKRS